jgi:hypothetical protein
MLQTRPRDSKWQQALPLKKSHRLNLIKLLGAYLSTWLSQINVIRRLKVFIKLSLDQEFIKRQQMATRLTFKKRSPHVWDGF